MNDWMFGVDEFNVSECNENYKIGAIILNIYI